MLLLHSQAKNYPFVIQFLTPQKTNRKKGCPFQGEGPPHRHTPHVLGGHFVNETTDLK